MYRSVNSGYIFIILTLATGLIVYYAFVSLKNINVIYDSLEYTSISKKSLQPTVSPTNTDDNYYYTN